MFKHIFLTANLNFAFGPLS